MSLARAVTEHRRHQAMCARERRLVRDALAPLLRHRTDLVALLPHVLARPDWFRALSRPDRTHDDPAPDDPAPDEPGGTP